MCWKSREILPKILEKSRNFGQFYFYLFSFLIELRLLNKFLYLLNLVNENIEKLQKNGKIAGKSQGNLSVRKVGTMNKTCVLQLRSIC